MLFSRMENYMTFLLLILGCARLSEASQPSVTVHSSTIYGLSIEVENTTVDQYLGIRFGQPPTGPLRFQKPIPAPLELEVQATSFGNPCWTLINNSLPMNEDCLFLNIFVPQRGEGETSPMPVMLWIHGGGFTLGSGTNYDGSLLAAQGNVIVVTTNYRLGPFGFLSMGDNSTRGNFGLWDQWLALTWVRDNIGHFGGDVTRITLFGESAGAASVNFQMTSPHSANLFQRAILHSGCRLCSWSYNATYNPLKLANTVAAAANCSTATHNDTEAIARLMTCLRSKPADVIHQAGLGLFGESWSPVIDGDFVLPYDTAAKFSGQVITGVNNNEGGLLVAAAKLFLGAQLNQRDYHDNIFMIFTLGMTYPSLMKSSKVDDVMSAIKLLGCVYRVNGSTDAFVPDDELEGFVGDSSITVCNQELLNSDPTTSDLYLYYFDHYPDTPWGQSGMDHTLDIDYTFGFNRGLRAYTSPFYGISVSQSDLDLAVHFRTLLTNFAKTGNPNSPATSDNFPTWPTYTKGSQSYLSVSTTPRVSSHLLKDIMAVWLEAIPSVLRSEGSADLEDTRFKHCNDGPTGTAGARNATTFNFVLCFVIAMLFCFSHQ